MFGVALHVIQDATSPVHKGQKAWSENYGLPRQILHAMSEIVAPPNKNHPLYTETTAALKAYKDNDLSKFNLSCPCN